MPDLSTDSNRDRWSALEAAKRRVLFGIENTGLLNPGVDESLDPPLTFEFKADGAEPIVTGHANGCITINLQEADPVERERARVEFDEPHRTLVGHFRHELGHYYWQTLVQRSRLNEFREVFGDEDDPPYEHAKQRYYRDGAPHDWQLDYVSAYASMHPWEDFAESFGTYLDLSAILSTANHFGLDNLPERDDTFASMLQAYQRIGLITNEFNRDMGLLDLVSEVFTEGVRKKLNFVHDLTKSQAAR